MTLKDEVAQISRSMITASHYNNLGDGVFESYIAEILSKVKEKIEGMEREFPLEVMNRETEKYKYYYSEGCQAMRKKILEELEK